MRAQAPQQADIYRSLKGENHFPVTLHVNDCPASCLCFIKTLVETTDTGVSIVGPLAVGVSMMNVKAEAFATSRSHPLEHLQVAIRVAERSDWAAANVLINRNRFAGFVVNEVDLRLFFGEHANGPDDPFAITSDPMFVSPGAEEGFEALRGFMLEKGSPCIRAGIPISNNGGRDLFGNALPWATPPSIGAHEFDAE